MDKMSNKKYIKRGVVSSLANVAFHNKARAPLKRIFLLSEPDIKEHGIRVVVHQVKKLPRKVPEYCVLHAHKYDEINLILSETGKLVYRIQLGKEVFKVGSPAAIYIPAGMKHSANAIKGKGMYVADIFTNKYKASK
jgi:2-isopropylmalate synthase